MVGCVILMWMHGGVVVVGVVLVGVGNVVEVGLRHGHVGSLCVESLMHKSWMVPVDRWIGMLVWCSVVWVQPWLWLGW